MAKPIAPAPGELPRSHESLPFLNRVLYASGSGGSTVLLQTLTAWVFFFYAAEDDGERLAPIFLVGVAMALGRLLDGVTDPIVGYWSDITRSPWGRRFPFIILGAPIMTLFFILIWVPPLGDETHWVNALWLAFVLQGYFLMVTVVGAPYSGIFPEVAVTKEERVSVSSWQLVFGLVGGGIALIGTGPLIDAYGFLAMGIIIALIGMFPRYLGVLGVRGRLHYQPPAAPLSDFTRSMLRAFRTIVTSRNFLSLVASLMLFNAGLLMVTQAVPFFVTEILERPKWMQAPVTGAFFIAALAAVPVIIKLTSHRDKADVYAWCLLGTSVMLPLLVVAGFVPGLPALAQVLIVIALIGLPLSGIFILPDPLLADVVDDESLATDSRREAMYFSSRATLEKLAGAIATGLFALLLGVFGSTTEEPLGIRLIGPVAGLCTFAAWLIFVRGYRLSEEGSKSTS